jgi:hypothetical protein
MTGYNLSDVSLWVQFTLQKCCLYQPDEADDANLPGYFDSIHPVYNYFILAKNRILIDPTYLEIDDKFVHLKFEIWNKKKREIEKIRIEHKLKTKKELKIDSSDPHHRALIKDNDGNEVMKLKAAYVPEMFYNQVQNKELLDYEILYIGRSVLKDNNIPVLDRTEAHSTYQKILIDYNQSHPDKELFLFFFGHRHVEPFDFPNDFPDSGIKDYSNKLMAVFGSKERKLVLQRVNLLESVLIHYFKPFYNDDFTKVKPNKKHGSFIRISELGLKLVTVEVGIENFKPKLFSPVVAKSDNYFIRHSF